MRANERISPFITEIVDIKLAKKRDVMLMPHITHKHIERRPRLVKGKKSPIQFEGNCDTVSDSWDGDGGDPHGQRVGAT
jgi:hypothetical protein